MYVYDRLYGTQLIAEDDMAVYQTPQFARLNRVSLSAIPTWSHPASVCASKGEHSRGVRLLAKLLAKREEWREAGADIVLAATLHDIATPPFSHLSELFQETVTGQNHEQACTQVVQEPELQRVIEAQGGNAERIIRFIRGEAKPLSDLVNGTIDLDNLDNTLRYGLSMGIIHDKLYDPQKLVNAFMHLPDGTIGLQAALIGEVRRWEECRRVVYEFVYSNENQCPQAMLHRALEFAFFADELPPEYFRLTDDEALAFLLTRTNDKTRQLVREMLHWRYFTLACDKAYYEVPPGAAQIVDRGWRGRHDLANQLAAELVVPSEYICVVIALDKGFKQIHLPLLGEEQARFAYVPDSRQRVVVKVFVSPLLPPRLHEKIAARTQDILASPVPAEPAPQVPVAESAQS